MKRIKVKRSALGKIWDRFVLHVTSKIFAVAIALTLGLNRERMSHNNGIGAKGKFHTDPDPALPPNEFWQPGREFPLRIRHAMATFYDDAMGAIRSISIKLSDRQLVSPFDLNLNTGSPSLFWNVASFIKLATMRRERYGIEYQDFYKAYPDGRVGAVETLRRHPTSFTNLVYYSKTPLLWMSTDGSKHYVKYRIIPYKEEEQTGMIFGDDLIEPENQRIIPGDKLSRNYLKDELTDRLKSGKEVKYRFQAQVRKAEPDEDPKIFNCCIDWPEDEFPYRNVGVLTLTEPLSWDESNWTAFSVKNLPESLKILPADSIYDYNSLNYIRSKSEFARKMRWQMYVIKGMPEEIPYNDHRNSSTIQ